MLCKLNGPKQRGIGETQGERDGISGSQEGAGYESSHH